MVMVMVMVMAMAMRKPARGSRTFPAPNFTTDFHNEMNVIRYVLQPQQLDGLSFPLTCARMMRLAMQVTCDV